MIEKNRFLTLTFKRSKSAILFGLQNFDRHYLENLHLNCVLSHSLNVMVCTIHLKYYEILQFNFCCFSSVTFGHYNSR